MKTYPTGMLATLAVLLAATAGVSCKKKETVFEMKTPAGEVKVEREKESGNVEIQVEEKE